MSVLRGKVVLITGASSGIGACSAKYFAAVGCKLSLTGRNLENLQKTVSDCISAGADEKDISLILTDVTMENSADVIIGGTIKSFEQLDILVNNAGILIPGSIENSSLEVYDQVMNVNVRSVFELTQSAVLHLKKTKGCIVNVSSCVGLRSFPGISAYCMSKAAIDQFTRTTALELAPYGVRVNSVNPAVIDTEIHKRGGMSEEDYAKFLERCKETHPLGLPGTVDEVAQAILFLADETKSSFITGVNLPVDGGRRNVCPR